jgi:prepilin-type N-terminal cleavage/methylation domain-containing protein
VWGPRDFHGSIPVIIKTEADGINTALKQATIRGRYRGSQSNKQDKKKANNMLNKFNKRRAGFTLVEIMIVVAIIALLAAIAVPGFLRARKRSQASRVINDLRLIDSAVDQYAIENNKSTLAPVAIVDWTKYLKAGTNLYLTGNDILTNAYGPQTVDTIPKVNTSTYNSLSDVAGPEFWSPYR